MNILVTGGTGLAGAEVIRQAIADPEIKKITTLTRRPLVIEHPKLETIIHKDFVNYSGLEDVMSRQDACLWCLGISQSQVSQREYFVITYNYALAAAKALLSANPSITFLFLSGAGADTTETSKTLFARVKGKTENALQSLGLKRLYIARPGGIRPIHKNPNTALTNKLMIPFFPLLQLLAPSMVINSVQLAKALLHIIKTTPDTMLFENKDLKRIASLL
ncbi:MAG TPA: NAD-dependent epimerase/dehydratase family protein [Chitinophagaceae bacterium]